MKTWKWMMKTWKWMPEMEMDPEMDDETIDMTDASDAEVLRVFKAMGDEDGIVIKKEGGNINLKDGDNEYMIQLGESYGNNRNQLIYEIEMDGMDDMDDMDDMDGMDDMDDMDDEMEFETPVRDAIRSHKGRFETPVRDAIRSRGNRFSDMDDMGMDDDEEMDEHRFSDMMVKKWILNQEVEIDFQIWMTWMMKKWILNQEVEIDFQIWMTWMVKKKHHMKLKWMKKYGGNKLILKAPMVTKGPPTKSMEENEMDLICYKKHQILRKNRP
jgi:hypothetical protein